MNLAKQHLDIGLFSTKRDEQLAFWQQTVGLPYDHMGKLGGGMQQHRHHMNGSILKMNHSRDPLPAAAPSGIVGLEIARDGLAAPQALADPDGNKVTLVPKGAARRRRASPSCSGSTIPPRTIASGPMPCSSSARATAAIAAAIRWSWSPSRARSSRSTQWRGPGYRYMTVQIWDCVAEYDGILARGGASGGEPRILGDTVRYAFVCDPDGNHIEISQRASLTASL